MCRESATKAVRGVTRMARCRANRRNTMDCAILNEIFIDDDTKKSDKRSMQLLRTDERDQKLAMGGPTNYVANAAIIPEDVPTTNNNIINNNSSNNNAKGLNKQTTVTFDDRCKGGHPIYRTRSNAMATKVIESCNRYMSVTSRPIGCRSSAPASAFLVKDCAGIDENSQIKSRQLFHDNFSNMVKSGSSEKQDGKVNTTDLFIDIKCEVALRLRL